MAANPQYYEEVHLVGWPNMPSAMVDDDPAPAHRAAENDANMLESVTSDSKRGRNRDEPRSRWLARADGVDEFIEPGEYFYCCFCSVEVVGARPLDLQALATRFRFLEELAHPEYEYGHHSCVWSRCFQRMQRTHPERTDLLSRVKDEIMKIPGCPEQLTILEADDSAFYDENELLSIFRMTAYGEFATAAAAGGYVLVPGDELDDALTNRAVELLAAERQQRPMRR